MDLLVAAKDRLHSLQVFSFAFMSLLIAQVAIHRKRKVAIYLKKIEGAVD